MQKTILAAFGFVIFLAAMAGSAQAYDSLCDKIGDATRRDLCRCRSDAGAKVSYRPDASGTIKVRETGVPKRNLGQVQNCMIQKDHKV